MSASSSNPILSEHLTQVAATSSQRGVPSWAARSYGRMLAHYYRLLVPETASVLEIGCGAGDLLAQLPNRDVEGLDLSASLVEQARAAVPHGRFHVQAGECLTLDRKFDVIILSDTLNLVGDVQEVFSRLHSVSHPRTRLILNFQNQLWRPLLGIASFLGLHRAPAVNNWLSRRDVINLCQLADWEVICHRTTILCPLPLLGLERLINRYLSPLLQIFGLAIFIVARPRPARAGHTESVSVVIPARNEAGNIEAAVQRTPRMGARTELIFVEGNSTDHTWREIQRVQAAYPQLEIRILQQPGRGKGDAVRAGFAVATGEILLILDADLTMPPEELPKFYAAVTQGHAEFANGCRLVYPMEKKAMQFLNMCANKTFGLLFTWMLGQPLKDTLCGTKVLRRTDYETIVANRAYFGDFDPFGDFDLLFGASRLNLRIADIPIRYRERTYGTTNIQRWKHGWLLLCMLVFAARKIRFV